MSDFERPPLYRIEVLLTEHIKQVPKTKHSKHILFQRKRMFYNKTNLSRLDSWISRSNANLPFRLCRIVYRLQNCVTKF